jgi:hypothetical protein
MPDENFGAKEKKKNLRERKRKILVRKKRNIWREKKKNFGAKKKILARKKRKKKCANLFLELRLGGQGRRVGLHRHSRQRGTAAWRG